MRNIIYYFVIDTDKYSGNFEREMCAYLTGVTGDCGVGLETAKAFRKEFPDKCFYDEVIQHFDDDGCRRPCEIYPTPGRFNGGEEHYDDDADMEMVRKDFVAKQEAYYLPLIERAEAYIAEGKTEWTRDLQGYRQRIEEAKTQEVRKWPAYESVAIAFKNRPSDENIEFMKQRAHQFVSDTEYHKDCILRHNFGEIEIRGFRLFEVKTTQQELPLTI